ncbi:hypothetical protein HYALB_00002528 [Hymenoscyphus albidus]|uniref:RING-type domain-containing protein n=1 Tax=Hymenoscyphus albidus TaxID=595503 RepID=A0A9N9LXS9_9HELO|nr:hypothetical protein HYALB_00002528 [Hymenoscyphus albidus]
MPIVNRAVVEVLQVIERGLLQARQTPSSDPSPLPSQPPASTTPTAPPPTMASNSGSGGPTSSPLLFFVALGFGVVFTNLWIIVGVKYCFRYNARNRALRNGEEVDPINMNDMNPHPRRRRREKRLMTMDEVNERFPLTKYKNWVASRAREGLPTNGGVTAPSSRAGSVRDVEGVIPSSPVETKYSVRPGTANSNKEANPRNSSEDRKSVEEPSAIQKEDETAKTEANNKLEQVRTTTSTVEKHPTTTSEDDDDDDDHIHTAVPPELLTNPGDSCAICIDTLEDDDDIRGLTCGHAFHAGCLDPWLTSRRACCPLCKADYWTPKPRPEGEIAAEAERSARRNRSEARVNMPQAPASTHWSNIRPGRLAFAGRFGAPPPASGDQNAARTSSRRDRRAQRDATPAEPNNSSGDASPSRRWNPLSSFSMPAMRLPGRNRQQQATPVEQGGTSQATPSQLEAGVIR